MCENEKNLVVPMNNVMGSNTDTSFIRQLYDKIIDVIGGDNPNQFFCLTMPGATLSPKTYQYDIQKEKPVRVAANESRLTNKLFDPCHITGADNGRQLATQFLTALDTLTPKLNPNVARAKNVLREMLNTNYSYRMDDGTPFNGTLQQVFYKLYGEWVLEKRKWAEAQNEKRRELQSLYPNDTVEDSQKRQEEFLIWYQTNAESYLSVIEAKLGKVLGIFSVNDMKIIEGILDSGTGAELDEARKMVQNARKLDPDGGYVYPVSLEPADWFKYLESDFTPVDLLESPEVYEAKYRNLCQKRNTIQRKISDLEAKDRTGQVAELLNQLDNAQTAFDAAAKSAADSYLKGGVETVKAIAGLIKSGGKIAGDAAQGICDHVNQEVSGAALTPETLVTMMGEVDQAQQEMVQASRALSDAAMKEIQAEAMSFSNFLAPLYEDLKEVQDEVDLAKQKFDMANAKALSDQNDAQVSLLPNAVANGFMEMTIVTTASSVSQQTSMSSQASSSSSGVNFLFGGYHRESSSASSNYDNFCKSENTTLEVAMRLTKVGIVRNWFNPGVFTLSTDMYNTSGTTISVGMPNGNATNDNLAKMSKCLFPCFPTALVIGKDVSIRFHCDQSISSEHKDAFQQHAASGGGFFCFHGSSSSSSSGENSSTSVNCSGKDVIIRFPGPQVLGYFLEATPEDKSRHLYEQTPKDISITEFIEQCKEMLDEMNKVASSTK